MSKNDTYSPVACCRLKGRLRVAFVFFGAARVARVGNRTRVYVDGFNLYYRALRGTPYRWLNLLELARQRLRNCKIDAVNYYTARVSDSVKAGSSRRQQAYLSALQTLPEITVHFGSFLALPKTFPIYPITSPPTFARVLRSEEKGSDVNLASHLVFDGCKDSYDTAVVVSNDTDLIEPIRLVRKELGKRVELLSPVKRPAEPLLQTASFIRHIRTAHLKACQFPTTVGHVQKPRKWCLQDPLLQALELALSGRFAEALPLVFGVGRDGLEELLGNLSPQMRSDFAELSALAKGSSSLEQPERRQALAGIKALADAARRA